MRKRTDEMMGGDVRALLQRCRCFAVLQRKKTTVIIKVQQATGVAQTHTSPTFQ